MSNRPAFIITVDTEGDNEWSRPNPILTRNAGYLPRFQALCEEFGFKPTWLTNFEMASSSEYVRFGRDVIARGAAEIGMHLHAWSSPPVHPLTHDDHATHPYLIEFSPDVMSAKIRYMTELLEQTFGVKMVSHRIPVGGGSQCLILGNRQPRRLPHQLGTPLVHRDGRGHHPAASIRNAHQLQCALYRAVFTVAPVQREKGYFHPGFVDALGHVTDGVDAHGVVAARKEGAQAVLTRAQ